MMRAGVEICSKFGDSRENGTLRKLNGIVTCVTCFVMTYIKFGKEIIEDEIKQYWNFVLKNDFSKVLIMLPE